MAEHKDEDGEKVWGRRCIPGEGTECSTVSDHEGVQLSHIRTSKPNNW